MFVLKIGIYSYNWNTFLLDECRKLHQAATSCFTYIKHTHASHKDIEMQPCNPMFQCSIRFHITLPPPLCRNSQSATLPAAKDVGPTLSPFQFSPFPLCRPCTFPVSVFSFLTSSLFSHFFCLSCFLPFVLRVVDLGAGRQPGQGARPEQTVGLSQGTVLYYSVYSFVIFNVQTVLSFYQMPAWFCCCCYCRLGFSLCFFHFLFSYSFLRLIPNQFFASH